MVMTLRRVTICKNCSSLPSKSWVSLMEHIGKQRLILHYFFFGSVAMIWFSHGFGILCAKTLEIVCCFEKQLIDTCLLVKSRHRDAEEERRQIIEEEDC